MEGVAPLEEMWENACFVTRIVAHAVQLSRVSGRIIRDVATDPTKLKLVNKSKIGGDDPQTLADRLSEYTITYSLRKKFGDDLIVIGEEGEQNIEESEIVDEVARDVLEHDAEISSQNRLKSIRKEDVVVWVDPLDGTMEYRAAVKAQTDVPEVTVLIGIAHAGRPLAGVIHQPYYGVNGRTVWGVVGVGVFGTTIAQKSDHRLIVTSRGHTNQGVQRSLDQLRERNLVSDVDKCGGCGYKVLRCIEGAMAYVYPTRGTKKWDTCAPEAVLLASGGRLTDACCRPIRYDAGVQRLNNAGIVATAVWAKDYHEKLVDAIPEDVKASLPETASPETLQRFC